MQLLSSSLSSTSPSSSVLLPMLHVFYRYKILNAIHKRFDNGNVCVCVYVLRIPCQKSTNFSKSKLAQTKAEGMHNIIIIHLTILFLPENFYHHRLHSKQFNVCKYISTHTTDWMHTEVGNAGRSTIIVQTHHHYSASREQHGKKYSRTIYFYYATPTTNRLLYFFHWKLSKRIKDERVC